MLDQHHHRGAARPSGSHAMAEGVAEQREQPRLRRRSASRSASGCSSTASSPSGTTGGSQRLSEGRQAALPAAIEELDFRRPRGLDRHVILQLAESHWVDAHQVVSSAGRPGSARPTSPARSPTPRSATATPRSICAHHGMFDELAIARADGRLARLMASWARVDVLVIDDFLLRPLNADQAADLLEIVEDRAQQRSTILTSQLPIANWHEALGDPTIADAVLDRLLEHAHRIELVGDSMRRYPSSTPATKNAKAP